MIIKDQVDYYKVKMIAEYVSSINDTDTLDVLLKCISVQMCKIGRAREGTCRDCHYRSLMCREIYDFLERVKESEEDQ